MDFYILLGIERAATLNDIKRAYKRLARRYHPDINPGDRTAAAQFRQIAEAYETLSDPDRRRRYDTGGLDRSHVDQNFGFEGFDFSVSVSGAAAPTFGDLFADVLRQRQDARNDGAPERGADLHQSLSLPFEAAMRGGHAGRNGGDPGDLYVTIRVEPHPLFRREGDDLHLIVPVAVHEAALGAKVEVPSLEGYARLRVPPGTQSGQRFRLRERGVPSARGGPRGDLVVEVRLVLPKVLDERSKELLREFGRINGDNVRE